MESASSEGAGCLWSSSQSLPYVDFFSKFPSLFDEELPNTEKYLFIFLFCLKSEFPATVTKPLLNVRMFGKCRFLVVERNWRAYNSKYISLHASLPSCSQPPTHSRLAVPLKVVQKDVFFFGTGPSHPFAPVRVDLYLSSHVIYFNSKCDQSCRTVQP